jgi:hypothetical protein
MGKALVATVGAALLICGLVVCGGSPKATQPSGAGLVVDITIAKGQVTPSNATLQAKVSQPITLRVTSDAVYDLHVDSVANNKFKGAAAANQTVQFSVYIAGNVDVELHHLDRTIATIQVRP